MRVQNTETGKVYEITERNIAYIPGLFYIKKLYSGEYELIAAVYTFSADIMSFESGSLIISDIALCKFITAAGDVIFANLGTDLSLYGESIRPHLDGLVEGMENIVYTGCNQSTDEQIFRAYEMKERNIERRFKPGKP